MTDKKPDAPFRLGTNPEGTVVLLLDARGVRVGPIEVMDALNAQHARIEELEEAILDMLRTHQSNGAERTLALARAMRAVHPS